jgi:hypothetical protein
MSSSESDKDETHSEEDALRIMQMITKNQNNLVLVASFMSWYYATYIDKNEPRTVTFSSLAWVMEALNTLGECREIFRIDTSLFYKLHDELVSDFGLPSFINMTPMESLGLFLVICGHALLQRRSSVAVRNYHQLQFLNHCRCATADNPGLSAVV